VAAAKKAENALEYVTLVAGTQQNLRNLYSLDIYEEHTLKNVNSCYLTKIYFYLVTSGGRNSNICLIVYFFNTSVFRHL
jgi:hypothetical protein